MTTDAAGQFNSHLLHIKDRDSGCTFLVDTGAAVSVIPPSKQERRLTTDHLSLTAANGSAIPTFETKSLSLNLGTQT